MENEMSRPKSKIFGLPTEDELIEEYARQSSGFFFGYNIVYEKPIKYYSKLVYNFLCYESDEKGEVKGKSGGIPKKEIAEKCDISERTVVNAIAELKGANLINVSIVDKNSRPPIYTVIAKREAYKECKKTGVYPRGYYYCYKFIFNESLPWYAILIYCFIARMANKEGTAFPTREYIAKFCSTSTPMVQKAIKLLKEINCLSWENRRLDRDGKIMANFYILWAKVHIFEAKKHLHD